MPIVKMRIVVYAIIDIDDSFEQVVRHVADRAAKASHFDVAGDVAFGPARFRESRVGVSLCRAVNFDVIIRAWIAAFRGDEYNLDLPGLLVILIVVDDQNRALFCPAFTIINPRGDDLAKVVSRHP